MLCVIVKIDNNAREKLQHIANIVKQFGLKPMNIHGHFTLITYIGKNELEFVERCKIVLKEVAPFPVIYDEVKVLPATSIIVASPKETSKLVQLHHKLSSIEPTGLEFWTSDENWEAHTTLVYKPDIDLYPIAEKMKEVFIPFEIKLSCIEFSKVLDKGYEIIETVYLEDCEI